MDEKKPKVSKAQQKAVTKYVKTKYDRFGLTMPKGDLDKIKVHASGQGESVNGFIGRAINETMDRDSKQPLESVLRHETPSDLKLPSEAEKIAEKGAERTGEAIGAFVTRAVETQFERDEVSLRLGTDPVTGESLKGTGKEK